MKRKCRKCGEWVRRCPVATEVTTGLDVEGWCGSIIPTAVCAVYDHQTGSRHVPELMF